MTSKINVCMCAASRLIDNEYIHKGRVKGGGGGGLGVRALMIQETDKMRVVKYTSSVYSC